MFFATIFGFTTWVYKRTVVVVVAQDLDRRAA